MKTEIIKYANGKEIKIMREGFAAGKKILKIEGYEQCLNDLFMQKENSIAEYNKNKKYWIF